MVSSETLVPEMWGQNKFQLERQEWPEMNS
jgi:hypothetical protein